MPIPQYLLNKYQRQQKALIKLANKYGRTHPMVIKKSQELDKTVVEMQKRVNIK